MSFVLKEHQARRERELQALKASLIREQAKNISSKASDPSISEARLLNKFGEVHQEISNDLVAIKTATQVAANIRKHTNNEPLPLHAIDPKLLLELL